MKVACCAVLLLAALATQVSEVWAGGETLQPAQCLHGETVACRLIPSMNGSTDASGRSSDEAFNRLLFKSLLRGAKELMSSYRNDTLREDHDPNSIRGIKMKKMATPMLMGMVMLLGGLIPLTLAKIALLGLGAIVSSKLALLLVGVLALKKVFLHDGDGHPQHVYEGVDDEVIHLPGSHRRVLLVRGHRLEHRSGLAAHDTGNYRWKSGSWKPSALDLSITMARQGRQLSHDSGSTATSLTRGDSPPGQYSEDNVNFTTDNDESLDSSSVKRSTLDRFRSTAQQGRHLTHTPANDELSSTAVSPTPNNSSPGMSAEEPGVISVDYEDSMEPVRKLVKRHNRKEVRAEPLSPGIPGWRRLDVDRR